MKEQDRKITTGNNRCIYCGNMANTKDHTPPKSFFSRPAPSNLITIPACLECNKSYSNDEEYFRTIISSARSLTRKIYH